MEEEAALVIFRCSVEKRKLGYTSMLGDGDIKAIGHINKHKPYGPEVEVSKEECVGHVVKRMYNRLTALCNRGGTDEDGRKVNLKGAQGLTDINVQKLTRYYKYAILNNVGNVDGMVKSVLAIFTTPQPIKNPAMNIVHKESIHGVNM